MEFGSPSGVRTDFRKTQLDAQQAAALPALKLGSTGRRSPSGSVAS
jgi:hypothetical protein